jgi:hypothetical protein
MKEYLNKITCLSLMTIIFAFISCNSETNENKIETTAKNEQQNIVETKDTSLYFIKRLLNCSPKEVERILGKPDSKIIVTNDCTIHLVVRWVYINMRSTEWNTSKNV